MKQILLLGTMLALAGCATAPPKAQIVEVPVAIGCLGPKPSRPTPKFGVGDYPKTPDGKDDDKKAAQTALAEASGWEGYATGLEVSMAGCTPKPSGPKPTQ